MSFIYKYLIFLTCLIAICYLYMYAKLYFLIKTFKMSYEDCGVY